MTDTLSLDIRAALSWLHRAAQPLSTVVDTASLEYAAALQPGSGAGEAEALWHDARTLEPATSEDLDLTHLTRQVFGQQIAAGFSAIKAVLVVNTAGEAGDDLLLGGAASDPWAAPFDGDPDAVLRIPAEGMALLVHKQAGWPVTEDTSDQLRLSNVGSGPITYRIVLAGV